MAGMAAYVTEDRARPLRERKKLKTRRALADAALRLFTENGFDATTLDELAEDAEVSKSTFSRTFPAKEAAGIEAEAELWTACLTALEDGELSGHVLTALHRTLAGAAALLRYTEHYRAQVKEEIAATLAARLRLDPDDLRLHVLAELVMTAWSLSGRAWVRRGGKGGRPALLDGFADAISAVPASLSLAVPG